MAMVMPKHSKRPTASPCRSLIGVTVTMLFSILFWIIFEDDIYSPNKTSSKFFPPLQTSSNGDPATNQKHQKYHPLNCQQFLYELRSSNVRSKMLVRPEEDRNDSKVFVRWMDQYDPPFWISTPQRDRSVFRSGIHPKYHDTSLYREILLNEIKENGSTKVVVIADPHDWGWFPLLAASLAADVEVLHFNKTNMIRMCESVTLNRWSDANTIVSRREATSSIGARPSVEIFPILGMYKPNSRDNVTASTEYTTENGFVSLDDSAKDGGWYQQTRISILDVSAPMILPILQGSQQLLSKHIVNHIVIEFTKEPTTIVDTTDADLDFRRTLKKTIALLKVFQYQPHRQWKFELANDNNTSDNILLDNQVLHRGVDYCQTSSVAKCRLWWTADVP